MIIVATLLERTYAKQIEKSIIKMFSHNPFSPLQHIYANAYTYLKIPCVKKLSFYYTGAMQKWREKVGFFVKKKFTKKVIDGTIN